MPDDQILDSSFRAEMPQDLYESTKTPWYKNPKIIISGLVALVLIAGISWYFFLDNNSDPAPSSNKVTLLMKGPQMVSADTETEFRIIYRNNENADLTNVHMDLIYPTNFKFKSSTPTSKSSSGQSFDLPIVREGKEAELVIRGKLSGGTGEQKLFVAKLHYKLSNFNSTFQVDQNYQVTIQAPNLTFDVVGPVEVPVGQDTTFTVNYANVSSQDYDNVALSLTFPNGFKFSAASLPPTKNNNFWLIGKLAKGASGHINVSGSFLGQNLDEQLVTGQLGQVVSGNFASQIASTATFRLKNAPISITQTASPSDIAYVGDTIQFTINFQNESTIGLTNFVITDTITSNIIDTSRFSIPDAVIAGSTITWRASTNPNLSILSPGKIGQVQFSLPLKSTLANTLKNQTIKNSVTVTSSEITTPIRAQDIEIKLSSKLGFEVIGDFVSGTAPMEVGKPSTFAITFQATNASNDLNSTEVVASLPLPTSAWSNVIIPESQRSKLTFDPSAGLIRWDVGTLPAFTGKITPVAKVTFHLTVTPSASDAGQAMRLLSNIQAAAFDSFTTKKLEPISIDQYSTTDIDDPAFQSEGSTVQ